MKVLKSWLKDFVEITVGDEELAEQLSASGTSVEEVDYTLDSNVVVAEIKEILPHPNADRLRIAKVYDGAETFTVVCGAPNIEVGQRVPLAKVGAVLPGCFEIKEAKIRGENSYGMLCAADELGLGDDHNGIIVLPNDYELGKPFNQYLEDQDAILDIEITPNRGDELSHIGVAREISALFGKKLKNPEIKIAEQDLEPKITSVKIETKTGCDRYFGREIRGIKIGPSPVWLKDRLEKLGVKSINNIVDATNYVMLDLGQPLHAFDLSKIDDDSVIIREAGEKEDLVTLDGEVRNLGGNDIVIADKNKAIALAGIMGGLNSEIDENTSDIFLESAEFNRVTIRKTAKSLSLQTEASYRFERGIDSGSVGYALDRLTSLILEIAGGEALPSVYTSKPLEQVKFDFEYNDINKLLGLDLGKEEINTILTSLGFEIENGKCIVPAWRHDVQIWQDLAEEIGRIYGYSKIKREPIESVDAPKKSNYFKKEYLKDVLTDLGFNEILTYVFLSDKDLEVTRIENSNLLEVANPLQPENKYLRKSLIPGLLKTVAKNPTFDKIALFEIGHTFTDKDEDEVLALATSGKDSEKMIHEAISRLSEVLQVSKDKFSLKSLDRDELQRFKIKKPVTFVAEIKLNSLLGAVDKETELEISGRKVHYRSLSKYPSVTRDLAFIVDKDVNADHITENIYSVSDLVNRVELFDEFASEKFGPGKKNVAYHLYLSHPDKTLTDAEANEVIDQVISKIEIDFGGKLRQ